MESAKKAVGYGILIWLMPFIVAFLIFPIHTTNRPMFESIMPVAISLVLVFFGGRYLTKVKKGIVNESIKLAIIWVFISVVLDILMFSSGPMAMSIAEYVSDIGLTYLMIPIITIGVGWVLEKK